MAEIVDLVSSSPPREPKLRSPKSHSGTYSTRPRVDDNVFYDEDLPSFQDEGFCVLSKIDLSKRSTVPLRQFSPIGSDDFRDSNVFDDSVLDGLAEEDFPVEQPAKRRRTRSGLSENPTGIRKILIEAEVVFDLSSEPNQSQGPTGLPVSNVISNAFEPVDHEIELPSFSSSAPARERSLVEEVKKSMIVELSSDDGMFVTDPVISSSQPVVSRRTQVLSDKTTNLLANLKSSGRYASVTKSASAQQASSHTISARTKASTRRAKVDDNIIDSSQPATASKSPAKPTEARSKTKKSNSEKDADKEQQRLDKEAAKEQKRLEKKQKAAEKQLATDKAEVNKKKTDKKKSSEEMIVELPYSIKGKSLGNQVEELMKQVDVDTRHYQLDLDLTNDDSRPVSIGTIIKWYRKVKSRYNEDLEEYESCPPKIIQEKHILVHLTAEEFCSLVVLGPAGQAASTNPDNTPSEESMKENLDTYITVVRSHHPNITIVLLIQGLSAFVKKSANTKNREYAAAVRALNFDTEPSTSTTTRPSKKRKNTTPQVDLSFLTMDHIDALTLHLQLSHRPLHIHHTTSVATSAQQISAFTQHLSTRPYRLTEQSHNLAHASFCMASGQFKTGQGDVTETFLKMLEQVNRITPSMALGIVTEGYETPRQLVAGFQKVERAATGGVQGVGGVSREERHGREKARLMLQDVMKAVNRDGGRSDRRLGPAASKRIYKVFTSRDENLRDGIV